MEGCKYHAESDIYYPEKFASYEEFKDNWVTNLVLERLQLICDGHEAEYIFEEYKTEIQKNAVFICHNMKSEYLINLFGPNYKRERITVSHVKYLVKYLQEKLPAEFQDGLIYILEHDLAGLSDDYCYVDLSHLYKKESS